VDSDVFEIGWLIDSCCLCFFTILQIACGGRAGAHTCLLDQTGRYDSPEYANIDFKPDFKVTSLAEVYSLLETNFELSP
jgi:hypothetical protein